MPALSKTACTILVTSASLAGQPISASAQVSQSGATSPDPAPYDNGYLDSLYGVEP